REPDITCEKCQIFVSSPICAFSSIIEVGCAKYFGVEDPISTGCPLAFKDCSQLSRTLKTRTAVLPPVRGIFRVCRHSRKCSHSNRRGSSLGNATTSPSCFSATGTRSTQLMLWEYNTSL